MYRISVMYPQTAGKKFDLDYYAKTHMPLVKQRLGPAGMVRLEVDRGVAGGAPGSPAPFVCVGHLYFSSLDDFQKGMKDHGKELVADIPNFTDIQPQFQIAEVALELK